MDKREFEVLSILYLMQQNSNFVQFTGLQKWGSIYWNRSKAFLWNNFYQKNKRNAVVIWPKKSMGSPSNPLTELEAQWGHLAGIQMAAAPKQPLRVACLSIRWRKEFCWFLKMESHRFHGTRLFPFECEKRMEDEERFSCAFFAGWDFCFTAVCGVDWRSGLKGYAHRWWWTALFQSGKMINQYWRDLFKYLVL